MNCEKWLRRMAKNAAIIVRAERYIYFSASRDLVVPNKQLAQHIIIYQCHLCVILFYWNHL